jgi:hypothetical protein
MNKLNKLCQLIQLIDQQLEDSLEEMNRMATLMREHSILHKLRFLFHQLSLLEIESVEQAIWRMNRISVLVELFSKIWVKICR